MADADAEMAWAATMRERQLVAVNFMDRTILSTIGVAVKTEIGMTDMAAALRKEAMPGRTG